MIRPLSFVLAVLLALAPLPAGLAQEATTLGAVRAAIETEEGVSAEDRAAALAILDEADAQVAETAARRARVEGYVQAASAGQGAAVDTLPAPIDLPATDASADALEAAGAALAGERAAADADLEAVRTERSALLRRPAEIAERLVQARAELAEIEAGLGASVLVPQGAVADARRALTAAHEADLTALTEDLETERGTIQARRAGLDARAEALTARLSRLDEAGTILADRIQTTLAGEARGVVAEAERLSEAAAATDLSGLAAPNETLAAAFAGLATDTADLTRTIAADRADLARLTASAQTAERVFSAGTLNEELATLLRGIRARLPQQGRLAAQATRTDEALVALQLDTILWEERLAALGADVPLEVKLGLPDGRLGPANTALARALIEQRAATLERLIDAGDARAGLLRERQSVLTQSVGIARDLGATLDRRLLWLPTNAVVEGAWTERLAAGAAWFLRPEALTEAATALLAEAADRPLRTVVLFGLTLGLIAVRPRLRRRMTHLSSRVGDLARDRYWVSPAALAVTAALTVPVPLLVGGIGGLMSSSGEPGSFGRQIAAGVATTGSVLFVLFFFRGICRDDGLLARHFHWNETARQRLRQTLLWFAGVEGASAFVLASVIADGDPILRYGIGLVAFVAASIGLAALGFAFFRPRRGVVTAIGEGTPAGRWLRALLIPAVGAPLVIGVMPLFGYFDTALELQRRVFQTALLMLLTAVLYGLLMRTLTIARRRYARRHRATEARRAAEVTSAPPREGETGEVLPVREEPRAVTPDELGRQGVRLARLAGAAFFAFVLFSIWKTLLPALGIADDIVLWTGVRTIGGVATPAPVTLWDVLLGVGILAVAVVLAKNARNLLEVSVFQRIGLDAGARYAAVTMLGYVLIFVGVIAGFGQLGVDWSKLQWIVAALGVGLGFGLQEIVANFVSGIIILFERPVRVGDTVTIGNLSGTVASIKIRATTITDFENREVLLPNKAIITDNVTNWTRNDTVTRILLPIGVAYGTDPDRVQAMLLDVVSRHLDVLAAPAPSVFFTAHGESSLDFEVRAFVDATAKRLPVAHDLNTAMNRALGEAGIEIPFPQRDLHMRSVASS